MSKHYCHALRCYAEVQPEKLMCLKHWNMLSVRLKLDIHKHYRKGQCKDKRPSRLFIASAKAAVYYVAIQENLIKRKISRAIKGNHDQKN